MVTTLRDVRDRLYLSQVDLAAGIGIPVATLRNYEQGRRSVPIEVFRAIRERWGIEAGPRECPHCGRPW